MSIGFSLRQRWSLGFMMLCALLVVLAFAGGASRADVWGQAVVRGAAWVILVIAILFGRHPDLRAGKPILVFLSAALLVPLIQLVPLPPDMWQVLPGRGLFVEAAVLSGQDQPWRPLSIVPSATANAAASLVVPFAALVCLLGLRSDERRALPTILLVLVIAATIVGLLQFSGVRLDNPLINDTQSQISGIFANRNHFALFLAIGCLLAPVWAISGTRQASWRMPAAVGLVLLFVLTTLATGSRAGIGLAALASCIGITFLRATIRRTLARYRRWGFPVLMVCLITIFVFVSFNADRAASIDRLYKSEGGQDLRLRALPTVLKMIETYFPFGSGFGTFNPAFRIHEPFALLAPTYFNHAHNDLLQIVLEGGLPGLIMTGMVIGWWVIGTVRAVRAGPDPRHYLPKSGSAILFLIFLSSVVDYPARTPLISTVAVIAAFWLAQRPRQLPALPVQNQHL